MLAAGAVLHVVAVRSTMSQVGLLMQAQQDAPVAEDAASANNSRQLVIGIGQAVVYLATIVLFLCWIGRAYRNVGALSTRKSRFAPGWAVGSWFVPFLNLVRPYQIVRETWWVSSSPSDADRAEPGCTPKAPAIVKWWWAVFLISGSFGQMVSRKALSATTCPRRWT